MGSFAYLINEKERICIEAYQSSASGNSLYDINEPEKLARFMDYCRENNLEMKCVSENWFDENINLEFDEPYQDW